MAQDAVVRKIKPNPRVAKGAGVSELIRRVPVYAKNTFAFGDTTTINLFELPGNTLVLGAEVRVTTAFDASGTSAAATMTIAIPSDTGTTTLFDSNLTLLQATGFHPSTAMGVIPSTGGYVSVSYTPGTTVAGQAEVYLSYVQFDDEL